MALSQDAEDRRLRELARFQILDTRPEPEFDRLCAVARRLTGALAAAVVFLDRDRSWLKASVGDVAVDVPPLRGEDVVARSLGGIFRISDLTADPLFATMAPTASGARAVIGVPLEARPGCVIGLLLAVMTAAGGPQTSDAAALTDVASAVMDRLWLHRFRIERRLETNRRREKDRQLKAQRWEIGRQRRMQDQTSRLARIGGWEYDIARRQLTWTNEIYRILELDRSYRPVFEAIPTFYREDYREQIVGRVRAALREGQPFEAETPVLTAQGRQRWVRFICEAEIDRDRIVRLIGTVQDVTEQRATEEKISFIATHDALTRLPNRAVFQQRLNEALNRAAVRDCRVGLILVDIDHFKAVNDTLGHHAGDALLSAVGERLVRAAGPERLVARLGGDEFAVLVPETHHDGEMMRLADLVREAVLPPVPYGDESIPATISIGLATGGVVDTGEQIFKDADIALYEAKFAGRNRAVSFDRSMRDEIELKQAVLRDIRQAIEREELLLHYQPKVSLRTGELFGFEALLRWHRPDGLVVGPSFFGVALEDPQISLSVGDFVTDLAVRQAAAWQAAGLSFGHVAVNTATSQFRRGDLSARILKVLKEAGLPPHRLMVEVTENVLLSREAGNVLSTLAALNAGGVKIALDDFGTGYASLTHLKEFPVDLLKIDRSFVSTLGEQRESRAIVRGITALAHDLGIEVIAEGIETVPQRDMLRHLGVNYGQGYYFARPIPPEEAAATWLAPRGRNRAGG